MTIRHILKICRGGYQFIKSQEKIVELCTWIISRNLLTRKKTKNPLYEQQDYKTGTKVWNLALKYAHFSQERVGKEKQRKELDCPIRKGSVYIERKRIRSNWEYQKLMQSNKEKWKKIRKKNPRITRYISKRIYAADISSKQSPFWRYTRPFLK